MKINKIKSKNLIEFMFSIKLKGCYEKLEVLEVNDYVIFQGFVEYSLISCGLTSIHPMSPLMVNTFAIVLKFSCFTSNNTNGSL